MKTIIYPGTFDPITNGHIDIIKRALKIFDKVIIAVVDSSSKKSMFSIEERVEMIKECVQGNVEVKSFEGLLVDFMKKENVNIILRGLRAVSDFDYEFQMAVMNSKLCKDIETMFLMTDKKYFYLSSSLVKEVASKKGCIKDLVPENVEEKIKEKVNNEKGTIL